MEIQHFMDMLIAVAASTGFWTFIQNVYSSKKKKKSAESTAMLALLHDRLYWLMQKYIDRGNITADEYENINYLYEPYRKLGGNGTCERLYDEVKSLKIQGGKSE
jgi:hypothetical protein